MASVKGVVVLPSDRSKEVRDLTVLGWLREETDEGVRWLVTVRAGWVKNHKGPTTINYRPEDLTLADGSAFPVLPDVADL